MLEIGKIQPPTSNLQPPTSKSMQSHNLKRNTSNKKHRQVGRGGRRGKTSGRGTKGQKARAGHKIRPAIRDIIKKIPKRRGYRFRSISPKDSVVDVAELIKVKGTPVTPEVLVAEGFVRRVGGRVPRVKILGSGEITKSVNIVRLAVSESARKKIEAAGGTVK